MEDRRALVISFIVALIILVAGSVAWIIRNSGDDGPDRDTDRGAEQSVGDSASSPVSALQGPSNSDNATGDAGASSASAASGLDTPSNAGEASLQIDNGSDDVVEGVVMRPSFDIVRIDANGNATMAGRGAAGATAVVLVNGEAFTEADIDRSNEWVVVLTDPLPRGPAAIGLMMRMPDGEEILSEQTVVVFIPESEDGEPLVTLGTAGGATRVLQSPLEDTGQPLALLAVDYDDSGSVMFSGRAERETTVRVLADGRLVGEAAADRNGQWSLIAGSALAPGVYDLQIDQLDAVGRVTGVVVVPFERASPEAVAAAQAEAREAEARGETASKVVVQPGNSLWRIARRVYGSGFQYTVIYAANDSQIRDPDLIYPGQIFDVPEINEPG